MPKKHQLCTIDDCDKRVKAIGLCAMHWKRLKNMGTTDLVRPRGRQPKSIQYCEIEDCQKVLVARGMCQMHYRRWSLYNDPNHLEMTGNKKPAKYKVVLAPEGHLNANRDGTIMEHRLVMSQLLGRALEKGENVHHKNGDTFDNNPENLELWNTRQPAGQRPSDKVEYAIMILKLYAPELLAESEN